MESHPLTNVLMCRHTVPKKIPSPLWRGCIKKVWEVDLLECPHCQAKMKIVSFITQREVGESNTLSPWADPGMKSRVSLMIDAPEELNEGVHAREGLRQLEKSCVVSGAPAESEFELAV